MYLQYCIYFFFFNDTATTEIYTLSLHDALPIYSSSTALSSCEVRAVFTDTQPRCSAPATDRKSTRLNSSHLVISYAVFCLKKKNISYPNTTMMNFQTFITIFSHHNASETTALIQ